MDALKDSQKEEPSAMHPRFVVRVAVPLFNATSPDPAAPAASDRESCIKVQLFKLSATAIPSATTFFRHRYPPTFWIRILTPIAFVDLKTRFPNQASRYVLFISNQPVPLQPVRYGSLETSERVKNDIGWLFELGSHHEKNNDFDHIPSSGNIDCGHLTTNDTPCKETQSPEKSHRYFFKQTLVISEGQDKEINNSFRVVAT
ncbi:hypothetical protein BM1_03383 [Bipolaris maydis]|nr:hypothetical protein BM1_03383 [Bipolaris maydis]